MPSDDLLKFVADIAGDQALTVEEDLGAGFVRLNVSEAERRQAKHDIRCSEDVLIELLRNSRDAGARRLFVATTTEENRRHLTIIDDGMGIPTAMIARVFEPRVTSKLETMRVDEWGVHGRGMALYSIASNALSAAVVESGTGRGTALRVELNYEELGERADQSSWPKLRREGDFAVESGPRNLLRHAVEFACAEPGLRIWFGSPNEILATMVAVGQGRSVSDDTPLWLLPAQADDADELADTAASLGLNVSERSAYRILRDEVAVLPTLRESMEARCKSREQSATVDLAADRRGLKIDAHDLAEFSAEVESAFDRLAEKYYLNAHDEPKLRLKRNTLTVSFDFDKES